MGSASFTAIAAVLFRGLPWPGADPGMERALRAAAARAVGAALTGGDTTNAATTMPPPSFDIAASPDPAGAASLQVRSGGWGSAADAASAASALGARLPAALASEVGGTPSFEGVLPSLQASLTLAVEGPGLEGAGVEAAVRAAVEAAAGKGEDEDGEGDDDGGDAPPTSKPASKPRRAGPGDEAGGATGAVTPPPAPPATLAASAAGIGLPYTDTPAPAPVGPAFEGDPFATSGVEVGSDARVWGAAAAAVGVVGLAVLG